MTEIVCPGKRLGRVSDFRAGPGTYVRGAYIYASVVGPKTEQAGGEGVIEKPYLIVSVCACTSLFYIGQYAVFDGHTVPRTSTRISIGQMRWRKYSSAD